MKRIFFIYWLMFFDISHIYGSANSNLNTMVNSDVVLTLVDQSNGFQDIRFKGSFSNWAVVQGYDDGTNGDTTANDGVWTVVLENLSGPNSYEWGVINTENGNGSACESCDGSDGWGTWLLDIIGLTNREFTIQDDGTITGATRIIIPYQGGQITKTVLFTVDMTEWLDEEGATGMKVFSVSNGDQMQVRGSFNGWNCDDPSICQMTRTPGTNLFSLVADITGFPDADNEYKYYMELSDLTLQDLESEYGTIFDGIGWEDSPRFGGGNRVFLLGPENETNIVELDLAGYYDLPAGGVIPDGQTVQVTFTVDMTNAVANGFEPQEDSVYISIQDRWLTYTQVLGDGYNVTAFDNFDGTYFVTQEFTGPFPWHMLYTWGFYDVSLNSQHMQEGGGTGFGRSRARYQHANSDLDCSWGDYSFPVDVWQFDPPMYVEEYEPANICFVLGVDDNEVPDRFSLGYNYPNPFNPVTKIHYVIKNKEYLKLNIYDLKGFHIKSLVNSYVDEGFHQIEWDATNKFGQRIAAGVYIYTIDVGGIRTSRKMLLLK